jgi:hypothetical protein
MITRSVLCICSILMAGAAGLAPVRAEQTIGLFQNDAGSFSGYTLFAPMSSGTTYLIDNDGKVVNIWESPFTPGMSVYLLDNGNLLRPGTYAPGGIGRFDAGGKGGRIEEYAWNGALVRDFVYSDTSHRQHHDIERLPSGNVLLIAWELKSLSEAITAGRDPVLLNEGEVWPDHIVEVEPDGLTGGNIVWEWHVWDHLVQDYDPTKANYGVVADHPERIDLNFTSVTGSNAGKADWTHTNAVDYDDALDQILLSVHGFSEIWIIDHSTTTGEAAGHTGGNSGKGGDLLYRWGNPQAYDRGGADDRMLFGQHDSRWIEAGLPGAGDIMIFNNGRNRPTGNFSSVDEIVPPVDGNGDYFLGGSTYGPSDLVWSYQATPATSFYGQNISGAHRLPNGNTLMCNGPKGTFIEVTPELDPVWMYINPIIATGPLSQGAPALSNTVFRAHRYGVDHPAFVGKDLIPGDSLELFNRPVPAPDGEAATDPMTADRMTAAGDWIEVRWDAGSCPADEYNLIFGALSELPTYALQGAECAIGATGVHDWLAVPSGDLFFLIVGVDDSGIYESSWGAGVGGAERNGSSSSFTCGVTTRDNSEICQ